MESRYDDRKIKNRQKSIENSNFLRQFDKKTKICYNECVIEIGG